MPSPIVLIGNQPAPATVAAGSTITVSLQDSTGVVGWDISCKDTDGYFSPSSIESTKSVNALAKTATFVLPNAAGSARFVSVVNGGTDPNGATDPLYSFSFKVRVLSPLGIEFTTRGEVSEGSPGGWGYIESRNLRLLESATAKLVIPGGSDGAVQFSDGGSWGGDPGLSFNKASDVLSVTGGVAIGAAPASTGALRLPNGSAIVERNASGTADVTVIGLNASNQVHIGCNASLSASVGAADHAYVLPAGSAFIGGAGSAALQANASGTTLLNGLPFSTASSGAATAGTIRMANAQTINARNVAGSGNVTIATVDATDTLQLGSGASKVRVYTSSMEIAGSGSVAGAGVIRVPNAPGDVLAMHDGSSGRTALVSASTNEVFLGTSFNYANQASNVRIYSASSGYVYFGAGSASIAGVNATGLFAIGNTSLGNVSGSFGGGAGVTFLNNAGTVPSSNPSGGAILYAQGGIPKVRTSDGMVASIATDPTLNGLRLTLSSGNPLPTGDVASSSTLYLTPHVSGFISIYDGSCWVLRKTGEVSLALSGLTASALYDVFAYWTGSAVALELSAAWTNTTTRSAALARQDGIWTKGSDATRRYVGTFRTISATQTMDTAAARFLYNENNQVDRVWQLVPSASWTIGNTGNPVGAGPVRQANNDPNMRIQVVTGNPTALHVELLVAIYNSAGSGLVYFPMIGLNQITANSGQGSGNTSGGANTMPGVCKYGGMHIGYNAFNWLEQTGSQSYVITLYGGSGNQASVMRGNVRM